MARRVQWLDWHPPRLVDPRDGDIEDDASSPERRSLLALAGNLLAEVSLPKLLAALLLLIVVPALFLGLVPLVASLWFATLASTPSVSGTGAAIFVTVLLIVALYGGRSLFRIAERSFWSLNAIAIQPGYVTCREVLLHLAQRLAGSRASETRRARARVAASAVSGVVICALALLVVVLVWPATRWTAGLADLRTPYRLALPALANAIVLASAYLAVAGLAWGLADATMPQPRQIIDFRPKGQLVRSWRVAHLSDLHVVGERYGFRLGSGRAGTRGNDRLFRVLERLDVIHRREPLDTILITGDLTDAGTSAEWAELLDAFDAFPRLRDLVFALPGNHDMNVVDRTNPARLDLPTSPKKRLREVRTVSALAALQGLRAHIVEYDDGSVERTMDAAIAPFANDIITFANRGSRRLASSVDDVWSSVFPMVRPPARDDGLGIIALNSNSESHFSFTNALGLVPVRQTHALDAAMEAYPAAYWIVALHHHIVEHPALGHALAERIGTTLINGNSFTRHLQRVADRAVVMHGHRHIDWMGRCGDLLIVSAPSCVLTADGRAEPYFYVHTVGVDASGQMRLATPERVEVRPNRA